MRDLANTTTAVKFRPALWRQVSALALCGVLAACASDGVNAPRDVSGGAQDITAEIADDTVAQMAYWGSVYDRDPSDGKAALNYGRALRLLGKDKQAVSVLNRAVAQDSENVDLLAEYGKALAAAGRTLEGADYLQRAQVKRPRDWVIISAEGVVLDQMGNHMAAREKYARALELSPDNPNVLNNMALSYALSGEIAQAETYLRTAVSQPSANVQMRQNLALVLGLRGNFQEARVYASADLSASAVENNIEVMRAMLAQPESPWAQLQNME